MGTRDISYKRNEHLWSLAEKFHATMNDSQQQYGVKGLCGFAQLPDKGRKSTTELGQRIRHLYVDQLHFITTRYTNQNLVYLRSSPYSRALHSLQQVFVGLYPPDKRSVASERPKIHTVHPAQETIMPNESFCAQLIELMKAYCELPSDVR
ncbi:hypothetical protein ACLMJK_009168 [Lecanora helva]